jgi:uncharacterized lipoprotein NlpE involved in copper resistance
MKRIVSVLLIAVFAMTLVGCKHKSKMDDKGTKMKSTTMS